MKIKSLMLKDAVALPGTQIANDFTLNAVKQPGIKLTFRANEGVVYVQLKEVFAAIPLSNVRVMILDQE